MGNVLGKISKISIYLLVFLLPLFFLPWTADVLDFNKQALLIFLVFVSLICWLLKSLQEGKISLEWSIFNLSAVIFLAVLGISTIFSSYRYGSFWGLPLSVNSSFLTVFGFVLLYFLIVNIFQKKEIFWLFLILIISSFLATLFGVLQLFGQFLFPFNFTNISFFNTIGTVNSLGIFAALLLPLIISLLFISKRIIKILLAIFGLTMFYLLFVVNFWVAWIGLSVGLAAILIFGISQREVFQANRIILPMFLLVIALFFGLFRISLPGLPVTPAELSLTQKPTLDISIQTLKESPLSLFLGTGPGTFVYNYSKFKSTEINQTDFWAVRFLSGASEILNKLTTTGILGLLSWLGILGIFIYLGFKQLLKPPTTLRGETVSKTDLPRTEVPSTIKGRAESGGGWVLNLGIFASWLATTVTFFLYPANFSFYFLFWFFTAGFIVFVSSKTKNWELKSSSLANIGVSFVFVFILILGIGIFFFGGQRYLAEVLYLQGLSAVERGDNQKGVEYLLKAVRQTNGRQDNYLRDISQAFLFRINEEILREDISQEEKINRINSFTLAAITSAEDATNVSPKNVANWAVKGFIWKNLINLTTGADQERAYQEAINAYQKAVELEPTNPYFYTELGRIYLIKEDINKAREQFQKAIDLKPDYAPGHFQMAMVYVHEGKIAEAIEKLEEIRQVAPLDIGLAFQLGVLYYNDVQFDKAQEEFERAIDLDPNYSNARYFLGLIYDRKNEKALAIEQFSEIERHNPENQEVKKILENLRAGKPALEGITPAEPPLEEKPLERL